MLNWHRSRRECYPCKHVQTAISRISLRLRWYSSWINSLCHNHHCLWRPNYTALWHMFAHLVTQWLFQHLPISCGEHYWTNYPGPANLQRHEPSHLELQYHYPARPDFHTKTWGWPSCQNRNIPAVSRLFRRYRLFQGRISHHTRPTVPPVVHPPRRVPEALRDRIHSKRNLMSSRNKA